jgi:hypothetical protein
MGFEKIRLDFSDNWIWDFGRMKNDTVEAILADTNSITLGFYDLRCRWGYIATKFYE